MTACSEKPDLIIFTGDNIMYPATFNATEAAINVTRPAQVGHEQVGVTRWLRFLPGSQVGPPRLDGRAALRLPVVRLESGGEAS